MIRFLTILLALTAATLNAATVEFNFASSLLYTQPGVPVTFTGTLTNIGATSAFINGDNVTSGLPFDDTPFLIGAPVLLNPGDSFTGSILTILPPPGTPLGLYPGVFSVIGGDNAGSADVLTTTPFAVQVVPEPATWTGGFALITILAGRRKWLFRRK